jgi:alkaline phosphatase D
MPVRLLRRCLLCGICIAAGQLPPLSHGDEVRPNIPDQTERIWLGPDFHANRLQDWRISNGRVECVEASKQKPVRIANLLTASVDPAFGVVEVGVRLGSIDTQAAPNSDQLAGFLIGCGDPRIDYRLSALTHHRPAEDGGMLAVVDGNGRVSFREFNNASPAGNMWSIGGALADGSLQELRADRIDKPGRFTSGSIDLYFQGMPGRRGYSVRIAATDAKTGKLISQATTEVNPNNVTGNVGLVSHLGPDGSSTGHWFADLFVAGSKTVQFPARANGPILCAMHTLSRGTLNLTAQMPPLGKDDSQTAILQIRSGEGSAWKTVGESKLVPNSYTFPFRIENWPVERNVAYRVVYSHGTGPDSQHDATWAGTIRKDPIDKNEIVVAGFTGHKIYTGGLKWNHNGLWFPHNELVTSIKFHKPDFLFFSGDQVYEGDLTGAQYSPNDKAMLDYLDKWYRWCWAFRDLTRDIPAVVVPDDHDVYHGNIWGAGGKKTSRGFGQQAQDSGGYKMPVEFVRMVEQTQTSHLPAPYDATPIKQGLGVYYTDVTYGGVSFAVIEDRKFKSSPTVAVPKAKYVNGWAQNPDYNPVTEGDVDGAVLLGKRQLEFLDHWAADWSNETWMKCVLSQTIFANVATLPNGSKSDAVVPTLEYFGPDEFPETDKPVADGDSNGWPQTGRNKALSSIRKAFAFHLAGDQHLGSCIQYGVDDWDDAGYALCVPSVANTWPRRWYPPQPGSNRRPDDPPYTGQFKDGFGNRISVHAVSNPVTSGVEPAGLYDRAPGYGIVRFHRNTRDITIECWPRWVDPSRDDAQQYRGWPIEINQFDQYGRSSKYRLPTIEVEGMINPVIQVVNDKDSIQYTVRINGNKFQPMVLSEGRYLVRVGAFGTTRMKSIPNLTTMDRDKTVKVEL